MPLVKPEKNERKKEFLKRCMADPSMNNEFPEKKQRYAVCNVQWDKSRESVEAENMGGQTFRDRGEICFGIADGTKGIDKEKGIIRGFAVISKGEAKGHNVRIDDVALDQIVELGNCLEIGLKSRFGHPNMSSTALGTFLGRVKNFRREEESHDVVRGDLYIDQTAYKTPNGNLGKYVLELAESDPEAFGSSIVFDATTEIEMDEKGNPKKDESGKELLPLVRFEGLSGCDIVDNPAANKGMFGEQFFSDSVLPSAEMTKFLDKFLLDENAVEKTIAFLSRYSLANKDNGLDKKVNDVVKSEPMEKKFEAIPVHKTPTSDAEWDGPANEARLKLDQDESYYRKAFAWQDPQGNPKTKVAYKFINHEVSESGEVGAANIKACQSGIGVLNGGRGGTNIPDEDRQGVYDHLSAHIKDAGLEPPEAKFQDEEKPKYDYKCESCGYEMTSEEDSTELKCPECGGVMKKKETPPVEEKPKEEGGYDMERIEKIEKGQEKLMRQATEGAVDKFMESHKSQILPAFSGLLRTVLIETSLESEPAKVITFAKEDKSEVKLSVGEAIQEIVCRLPSLVEFSETAEIDPSATAIDNEKKEYAEIVKYSKEHNCSISEARKLIAEEKSEQ